MENFSDALADLPFADADRQAHDAIEHHREQMQAWRQVRARRIASERAKGRTVADIAAELGITPGKVWQLLEGIGYRGENQAGGRYNDPGPDALCDRCGHRRAEHGGPRKLGNCPGETGTSAPRFRLRQEDKDRLGRA